MTQKLPLETANSSAQNTKKSDPKQSGRGRYLATVILSVSVLATLGVSWALYHHTVTTLTFSLIERLEAIVNTASVQFDDKDLAKINQESDYKKPVWRKVVGQLIKIREQNPDIVFAYILRKMEGDPTKMVFVADSHSLNPYAKIDLDGNGIINDADALNPPGDYYEDAPQEAWDAYEKTIATGELYEDQWGVLTSGYAPIKDAKGNTVAVMVVDVRAKDFTQITTRTLWPFVLFMSVLVFILFIQTISLIRIWNRRLEFMADLDKQKDELLSIVSHQLATPVSSAKWYIEMLLDGDLGKLTKEQQEHLDALMPVLLELNELIYMLLDVSRIQLGRMVVHSSPMDFQKIMKEINDIIEPKMKEKSIEFHSEIQKDITVIDADRRLLLLVLSNLLSNAAKYTPEGGKVDITVTHTNGELAITVKDTGVGIPHDDQAKIFDKLYRAANVGSIEGNGLGLYAVKGAVESMGGSIRFESTPVTGTTFFVKIPIERKD